MSEEGHAAEAEDDADGISGLVARAKAGDSTALDELFQRYRPRLVRYIDKHTSVKGLARTSAEDIVQDALLTISSKILELEYRGVQPFESWLMQICEGKIRDFMRHLGAAKRDVDRERSLVDREGSGGIEVLLPGVGASPSRAAYRGEKGSIIERILAQLSDRHSTVIRLRHLEGLAFSEIGAEMEISEDAAKALYGRAAVRFRAAAGKQPGVGDFTEVMDFPQ